MEDLWKTAGMQVKRWASMGVHAVRLNCANHCWTIQGRPLPMRRTAGLVTGGRNGGLGQARK